MVFVRTKYWKEIISLVVLEEEEDQGTRQFVSPLQWTKTEALINYEKAAIKISSRKCNMDFSPLCQFWDHSLHNHPKIDIFLFRIFISISVKVELLLYQRRSLFTRSNTKIQKKSHGTHVSWNISSIKHSVFLTLPLRLATVWKLHTILPNQHLTSLHQNFFLWKVE